MVDLSGIPEDIVQERVLNLLEMGATSVTSSVWWLGTLIADYRAPPIWSLSTRTARDSSIVKFKLVPDEAVSKS
ncbi:MAG: hypothetical protein EU536_04520 [Promethearchaeota archaeon]|nr:MAG: hypothetical protein EU536_04520 [Candidatus Lokiarchaeota archaeon]